MNGEIISLIGNLGFPIAISVYLLWERMKKTEKLEKVVENNTEALEKLAGIIEDCPKR